MKQTLNVLQYLCASIFVPIFFFTDRDNVEWYHYFTFFSLYLLSFMVLGLWGVFWLIVIGVILFVFGLWLTYIDDKRLYK